MGGRGRAGAGGDPVSEQPIESVEDIPPELRDLFIRHVKAAVHVQEEEIRYLHAKLKDATRRGYDLAMKNLANKGLYQQWWRSPLVTADGVPREHFGAFLADVGPGGRFWEADR